MEYRKIIKLGKTTCCVTLPKKWVQKNSLASGDVVTMEKDSAGDLIINSRIKEGHDNSKEIVIRVIAKDTEHIQRDIISAYINDYSRIILTGDIKNLLNPIQKTLSLLTATELIDVQPEKIVIGAFLDVNETSLDNIITRLNMMIISILLHIRNILSGEIIDYSFLQRDEEINRLYFLALRVITRIHTNIGLERVFKKTDKEILMIRMALDSMEKIADKLNSVGQFMRDRTGLKKIGKKTRDVTLSLIKDIEEAYKTSFKCYYNKDRAIAHGSIDRCKKLAELCEDALSAHYENFLQITGKNASASRHLKDNALLLIKIRAIPIAIEDFSMIVVDNV